MMIWELVYTRNPGRMDNITQLYMSNRPEDESEYDNNPKLYSSEKELFKNELIQIIKFRQSNMLSAAYDNVLDVVDDFVKTAHCKYPELLI